MNIYIQPFCVYLTIYSGKQLPPFYIGSGTTKNILKHNSPYRGSVGSKKYKHIWKDELSSNPTLFKTKIIKQFDDRTSAYNYEKIIQQKLNADLNPLYVNKTIANTGFDFSGYTHTLEARTKMSAAKKGRPSPKKGVTTKPTSEETKIKLSIANKGIIRSEETKLKMSAAKKGTPSHNKGKKFSEETKSKMSVSSKLTFLSIIETKKSYPKRLISLMFPEFKQFY